MTSDSVSDTFRDRQEVSALLDDYARGVDTRDWDLVMSVFTDDAKLDYSAFGGPNGSAKEVVDWIAQMTSAFVMTQHHITNRHITLDGDEAVCVSELFAPLGAATDENKMAMLYSGGSYNDRMRRTPDGWRISSRIGDKSWLASGPEASGPRSPQ